jgi:hypothetical protein
MICIYVTREGNERVISSTAMTSSNSYYKIWASGPGRKMQNLRPKKAETQLQLAASGPQTTVTHTDLATTSI